MNYERLNKNLDVLQGHIHVPSRYQAQAFILMLEQSFYDNSAEYSVTRIKHEADAHCLKMKLTFPRACSFIIKFGGGSLVELVCAKRKWLVEVAAFEADNIEEQEREEAILRKIVFNQMNEKGAQLHNLLRVVSNVYRVCNQMYEEDFPVFKYLIQAYSKFAYPACIWVQPLCYTAVVRDSEGKPSRAFRNSSNEVEVTYSGGSDRRIKFLGTSSELIITPLQKHSTDDIYVSAFGLGDDRSPIIDTICWYMKLSGIVQFLSDSERCNVDTIIDFNTGYLYREPESIVNSHSESEVCT